MNQIFNYFNQAEVPPLTLCTPAKQALYPLPLAQNIHNTLVYNGLSELMFDYPESADGNITTDAAYDSIKGRMLVLVEDIGYYIIDLCPEKVDGATSIKSCTCWSLESELNLKRVTNFTGTYTLTALLTEILRLAPTWTIGTIDSTLLDSAVPPMYRTFGIGSTSSNNQTLYNFLMTTVEKAYGCVFIFDTFNKTISAEAVTRVATIKANTNSKTGKVVYIEDEPDAPKTNIYLSFENLIKSIQYNEITDELCTALSCYGGTGLDIHNVNPLGSNVIYNFDYFMTTEWMTQGLIDALNDWEALVDTYQTTYSSPAVPITVYADLLTQAENYNLLLNKISADLSGLYSSLGSAYSVRAVRLQDGLDTVTVDGQIANLKVSLTSKQIDQASVQQEFDSIDIKLRDIVHKLYFTSKLSYDNFLDDVTGMQTDIKTMIAQWMLVYNVNTFYPDFDPTLLSNSAGTLQVSLNTALKQATILANSLTAGYSSYPPEVSDIITIKGYITDLKTTLLNLYNLFQSIIPSTDITITLDSMVTTLTAYLDIVSYPNNMTYAQYLELSTYIYENTYTNNNIITTDLMTPKDIQAQSQYLYDQSIGILVNTSQPRYEFSGEFSNFITLPDYTLFTQELDLGSSITIKKDDDTILKPILLEISITWDNPTEFTGKIKKKRKPKWGEVSLGNTGGLGGGGSLVGYFSNHSRLDDAVHYFTDITGKGAQLSAEMDTTTTATKKSKAVTYSPSGTPPPPPPPAAEKKTYTWTIDTPVVEYIPGPRLSQNLMVTRIDAYIITSTSVTFNILEQTSAGGAGGTAIMGSNMVAVPGGTSTTTFAHASLTAGNWLTLHITGVNTVNLVTKFVVTISVTEVV